MNLELTHAMAFGLSLLVLLIWCVLVFARAGFWRVRKPAPSPALPHGRPWSASFPPAMRPM